MSWWGLPLGIEQLSVFQCKPQINGFLFNRKLDLASHCHSFQSFLGHDTSSWGYSYHGKLQHAGVMTRYGDKWGRGDVIGVHVDTWRGHVYFYKNGKPQGLAFEGLQVYIWLV